MEYVLSTKYYGKHNIKSIARKMALFSVKASDLTYCIDIISSKNNVQCIYKKGTNSHVVQFFV